MQFPQSLAEYSQVRISTGATVNSLPDCKISESGIDRLGYMRNGPVRWEASLIEVKCTSELVKNFGNLYMRSGQAKNQRRAADIKSDVFAKPEQSEFRKLYAQVTKVGLHDRMS